MFNKSLLAPTLLASLLFSNAYPTFAAEPKTAPLTPLRTTPIPMKPNAEATKPIVLGYYSEWSRELQPDKIRFDRFTHLVHAFASVDAQGKILTDGNVPAPSSTLTSLAHKAGVKVLLGLGGGSNGPNFGKMARDPLKAEQFVRAVVQMVRQNGYDGVDIDWEYPDPGDTDTVTAFVALLHSQLKAANPNALLAMAVSRGNYYGQWFDGNQLRDKFDFIQIMTYDFHGPWNHAGHNAPLYGSKSDPVDGAGQSFQGAVDLWVGKGFSKNQLLVGVPCYGRGFAATAWGQKSTVKSPHEEVTFKQIPDLLRDGWKREWDAEATVPWLRKPGVDELISYEDEVSARAKGEWARKAGVGGFFFWQIEQDFVKGDNAIVAATRAGWDAKASQP